MNYSSAKSIFKIYRREGRLNKKIFKRRAEDLEDGDFEGTPMSDDLESSDNGHESESPVIPKQEFSTPEVLGSLGDQPCLKIVVQARENHEETQNSPLLKREEIEQKSVSSVRESMEELKQKVKIQEELVQPSQNHRNFFSMEDLVKQRPFLFEANSGAISSKESFALKAMQQQPMFPIKMPGSFVPNGFMPNMEPLQMFGQNAQFIPQYNMGPALVNKMNPYFANPYMQSMQNMQNMNGMDPFINYSLFNNYQHRMSSSSHNTSNHLN